MSWDRSRVLKQQNPPREEVRWVSLVVEGLLGGEETIRFDGSGGGDTVENS